MVSDKPSEDRRLFWLVKHTIWWGFQFKISNHSSWPDQIVETLSGESFIRYYPTNGY
jgi:hypothetical protein